MQKDVHEYVYVYGQEDGILSPEGKGLEVGAVGDMALETGGGAIL